MKIEKALELQEFYKNYVHSIFHMNELSKATHDRYLDDLMEMYSEKKYKSMPQWAKSYVDGVKDTLFLQVWHEKTYQGYKVRNGNGKIITSGYIGYFNVPKWSEVEYVGQFWNGTVDPYCLKKEE